MTTTEPDVRLLAAADRGEGLHRRAAEIIDDLDRLDDEETRLFRRMEDARAQLLEIGSRWEPVLSPARQAAYGAWRQHGNREHRLELASLAEAPVPPEAPSEAP
ncbi:MAG TPA: hypothetical protein VKB54_06995 [Solirubrobacteraceae bacterium]|nr:hypothetical protein [Solirubrobacteraceae bacterium]